MSPQPDDRRRDDERRVRRGADAPAPERKADPARGKPAPTPSKPAVSPPPVVPTIERENQFTSGTPGRPQPVPPAPGKGDQPGEDIVRRKGGPDPT